MGLLDQINEVLNVTPRKYWGEKANRLGSLLGDAANTGAEMYGSANGPLSPEHASTLGGLLMDFSPLGDAKSAYDGVQSARQGDYLGAALGGLGALPMVPNLGMMGGMIKTAAGRIPETETEISKLAKMLERHGVNGGVDVQRNGSNVSSSNYLTFKRGDDLPDLQVRISNHGDRYPNQLAGSGERFSVDPESRNTYEEAVSWLKSNGVSLSKTQKQPPMPEWVKAKSDYAAVYPQAVKNLQAKGYQGRADDNYQLALGTEIGKLLGMY